MKESEQPTDSPSFFWNVCYAALKHTSLEWFFESWVTS